ncbi:MAG: LapA family protein [Elusimicrobia bacterium]|nr:LapA family protein [Elusimicrobiota bacterium]
MSQIKLLIALAILVLVAVFSVFAPPNLSNVPPTLILVVSLFIGAAFSAVLGIADNLKLSKKLKEAKKENSELSEKIKELQLKIREYEEKEENKNQKPED